MTTERIAAAFITLIAAFVASVILYYACRETKLIKSLYKFGTQKAIREKVFASVKANRARLRDRDRAFKARATFDHKHESCSDIHRSSDDLNPLVVGSSAWLMQQGLATAFGSSINNHSSLSSALSSFDHSITGSSPYDSSSPWADFVTGGTDMTGGHGMAGHHDQFPSSHSSFDHSSGSSDHSSHSSHDPFA